MSTTSVSGSATSTSSIDVASIVSQLMTIENKPLDALKATVSKNTVKISDLGLLKSNLTSFQSSLAALESPASYNTTAATSSNSSNISATSTNGAALSQNTVTVNQTAQSSQFYINNLSSNSAQNITLGNASGDGSLSSGFSITVAGTTYNSTGTYTDSNNNTGTCPVLNSTNLNGSGQASLNDLASWINSLASSNGAAVSSSILNVSTSPPSYALAINGTLTGKDNGITFSGFNGKSLTSFFDTGTQTTMSSFDNSLPGDGFIQVSTNARDTLLNVNGIDIQRSTNSINDAIPNVTLKLLTPVTLNVSNPVTSNIIISTGQDNSSSVINNFISSYNAVIGQYQSMTAKSSGSFADSPGLLSYIDDLKLSISRGALKANQVTTSLATLGMDIQPDGTLKFNSTTYSTAISNGLLGTLSAGIKVGSESATSNLSTKLTSMLSFTGPIDTTVQMETDNNTNLTTKENSLSLMLAQKQTSYTAQYSSLNALLFTLNQTSSQLTSSLAAVTNINSGK